MVIVDKMRVRHPNVSVKVGDVHAGHAPLLQPVLVNAAAALI